MNLDDEIKALETLVTYAEERLKILRSKSKESGLSNESDFLQSLRKLSWRDGSRQGNSYCPSSQVPLDVKEYMRTHGKPFSGGFTIWAAGFKYHLAASGILGRDIQST